MKETGSKIERKGWKNAVLKEKTVEIKYRLRGKRGQNDG